MVPVSVLADAPFDSDRKGDKTFLEIFSLVLLVTGAIVAICSIIIIF